MKYFEITLKNQNPLVCLEEQGEKKPMVKACVGKEILKGPCVLGRRLETKTEAGACTDWIWKNGQSEHSEVHERGWLQSLFSPWFL